MSILCIQENNGNFVVMELFKPYRWSDYYKISLAFPCNVLKNRLIAT